MQEIFIKFLPPPRPPCHTTSSLSSSKLNQNKSERKFSRIKNSLVLIFAFLLLAESDQMKRSEEKKNQSRSNKFADVLARSKRNKFRHFGTEYEIKYNLHNSSCWKVYRFCGPQKQSHLNSSHHIDIRDERRLAQRGNTARN